MLVVEEGLSEKDDSQKDDDFEFPVIKWLSNNFTNIK